MVGRRYAGASLPAALVALAAGPADRSLVTDDRSAAGDYHYLGSVDFPCELRALRSIQGDDQRYDYAGLAKTVFRSSWWDLA